MKKISFNSNVLRVIYMLISFIIPLSIVAFNVYFVIEPSAIFTKGTLIVFILYCVLLLVYFRFVIFDWDLFLTKDGLELRRLFNRKEFHNTKVIEKVQPLVILTRYFYVFRVKIEGEKYIIKLKPVKINYLTRVLGDVKTIAKIQLKELNAQLQQRNGH